MKSVFFKSIFSVALGFVFFVLFIPQISADQSASSISVLDMVTGDIESLTVNNLNRVSVTNPEVADIADAQSDKISVLAKRAGETVLFLWDNSGKHTVKVRVVNENLEALRSRIERLLDEANISGVTMEVNEDEGKVVMEGSLSKEDKDRLEDILQPFSENLLNLVRVEKSEDLIEVDMQVVEISTTLEKELGIEWGTATNTTGTSASSTNSATNSGSVLLNYNETLPSSNGSIKDFFKIGNFYRTTPLEATVNALLSEGKARLISKPRLVVVSGKQASFLVGGEIPINTTTTNTTGSTLTQNTSYTQYGVNMTVTPTIREGKIEVILNVDIRDVDNSSDGLSSNGNVAFITRTASTNLLLDNKQTVALAGLIKYSDSVTITKVPFLGDIPILGLLFRNRSEPADSNTEMVIILTPTVVSEKKFAKTQVVMPTPSERAAYREFDAKYEHEPLPSWPASADVTPPAPPTEPGSLAEISDYQEKYEHAALPALPALPAVQLTPPSPPVEYKDRSQRDEIENYATMVQMKISHAISYPSQAIESSLNGTVKLRLHILRDGSLQSVEVMSSSGDDILDKDALQAARRAAPYDVFSSGIKANDLVFTVPIVYNKIIGGQEPSEKAVESP